MSERTPVSEECGKFYQSGVVAMEKGDLNSAIASFMQALEIEPGFLLCRQALRGAQKKAAIKKPGFFKRLFQKSCFSTTLGEAEVLLHLQPLRTISLAEQVLNQDPGNVTAHKLLAQAALAADLPGTAVLSLQELANEHPYHRATQMELAEALAASGDTSSAAAVYGQLLKDNPRDGKVLEALKRIPSQSVAEPSAAPEEGHTDQPAASAGSSSPRPVRPQQGQAKPGSADDAIIQRFEPLLQHGPRNIKFLKMLAEAYARKMMFDKSLSFYKRALEIAGGKNEAIEAAIAQTTLKKMDSELRRLDPKTPEYSAQCERIQNQRLEYQWQTMANSH